MRIIAGSARGRKLVSPGRTSGKGAIRPTADRAREALFSILGSVVAGARVLDLFAGTGALGLEALSRGASTAMLIDASQNALQIIRRNVDNCGFNDQAKILKLDLNRFFSLPQSLVPEQGFSLIFLDPPYRKKLAGKVLQQLLERDYLTPKATVILEDDSSEEIPSQVGRLKLYDVRRYGETGFWLYS